MTASSVDRAFAGSIPQLYETYLVPLIFAPYARDLAERVVALGPTNVLEVAAGTGAVTRRLAATLPTAASLVATDLNQPMLDRAAAVGTVRPVEWRQADVAHLPFPDASFDTVVCQFGVMFFPDKAAAFAEMRRVLRPGGTLLFNVWDRIEHNEFADAVSRALADVFPADPPRFLDRVPYAYNDHAAIAEDLARGGFAAPATFDTLAERSRANAPGDVSVAYCHGTPLRGEIEARDGADLTAATAAATEEVARRFGSGPVEGKIQAHVITTTR